MAFAFTVEDGTGLAAANAYIDAAFADDYHDGRGNDAWSKADGPKRREAIVRATDHIDQRFGHRFIGYPKESDQSLAWPRSHAYLWDAGRALPSTDALSGIPGGVKKACAEYALRALSGQLAPDQKSGPMLRQQMKGGGLEREVEYAGSGSAVYPEADRYLRPYLAPARVVR